MSKDLVNYEDKTSKSLLASDLSNSSSVIKSIASS